MAVRTVTDGASVPGVVDNRVWFDAPEHVSFSATLAGPASRAGATLVDAVLRGLLLLVGFAVAAVSGVAIGESGVGLGIGLLLWFVLEWGYHVFFEVLFAGRSPGKMVFGLRVVREGGYPVGFAESLVRNLLRGADALPVGYLLGAVVASFDPRMRRLGDMAAGTLVVVDRRDTQRDAAVGVEPPTDHELAAIPPRVRLSLEERRAVGSLLRRSALLQRARRAELAELLAPAVARRHGVEPPADPLRFLEVLHAREDR
jgi:uncharacterized RDD family membrane protein YckC